jgi:aryl-alcohol dehydrogenase-like predicted oxidoreductase
MRNLMMQTRQLGNTELRLTVIGLGTWAMGGPWEFGWGPQDDKQAVDAIVAAVEAGINWIDTAPIYGCGHAEELIGQALQQVSEIPLIATKCGLLWDQRRCKQSCLDPESIREECHNSLKRLHIDVIDLYQLHWPHPPEEIERAWEAMVQLREQGKVRYLGVSNCTVEQMERLAHIHPIHSSQPIYSMIHRDIESDHLDYCREQHIGIVAYSTMGRGLLTGKFDEHRLRGLAEDDHRKCHPDFQEPAFSVTLELVDKLQRMLSCDKRTLAQLAIAWVLRRKEVTSAIVGARHPKQIQETVHAADYSLTESQMNEIDRFLQERNLQLKGL